MVSIILTGHAYFAPGLASAIEMIAGPQDGFEAVAFCEGAEALFPQKMSDAIAGAAAKGAGVLVMCDLFGGTPFNQAMVASRPYEDVEVIAGVNLPMLLEAIVSRTPSSTTSQVIESVMNAATAGICLPRLELSLDDDAE